MRRALAARGRTPRRTESALRPADKVVSRDAAPVECSGAFTTGCYACAAPTRDAADRNVRQPPSARWQRRQRRPRGMRLTYASTRVGSASASVTGSSSMPSRYSRRSPSKSSTARLEGRIVVLRGLESLAVRCVRASGAGVTRPQFSWTRIKGESDVEGGGGHGAVGAVDRRVRVTAARRRLRGVTEAPSPGRPRSTPIAPPGRPRSFSAPTPDISSQLPILAVTGKVLKALALPTDSTSAATGASTPAFGFVVEPEADPAAWPDRCPAVAYS